MVPLVRDRRAFVWAALSVSPRRRPLGDVTSFARCVLVSTVAPETKLAAETTTGLTWKEVACNP